MKRVPAAAVIVAAVVAAVAIAVGVEAGWWHGGEPTTPSAAISAQASLSPIAVHFGDPLTARVVVTLDPARAKPASVRLVPRFGSYRVARDLREVRQARGSTTISYTFSLECLGAGCAPGRPQVVLGFADAELLFRTRNGAQGRLAVSWPSILLASRLDDADRADPIAHLRVDTSPPPISYSLSPGPLADGLVAASVLLVLAAGALLFIAFRRPGTPAVEPAAGGAARTPLEDALQLVRAIAADGQVPELRRLALQRLVRELRGSDHSDLAQTAGRLAWSDGAPSADALREFADRVEQELPER